MSTHCFSSIGYRLRLESPHSGGFKKQPKYIFIGVAPITQLCIGIFNGNNLMCIVISFSMQ